MIKEFTKASQKLVLLMSDLTSIYENDIRQEPSREMGQFLHGSEVNNYTMLVAAERTTSGLFTAAVMA